RLEEAESFFRRTLAINEATYGQSHPSVAGSLNNLADVLQATDRLSEAEEHYRCALAIWERSLGPDDPNVASALNNLAGVLRAKDHPSEAAPLLRRVLEILLKFGRSNGREHPNLRHAIANYVGTLQSLGRTSVEIRKQLDEIGQPFGMALGGRFNPK